MGSVAEDGQITVTTFTSLVKLHDYDDTQAIKDWDALSMGADTVEQTTVREFLRRCGESPDPYLEATFSDELWDQILSAVMAESDFMVDMNAWLAQIHLFARMVRALKQVHHP